MTNFIRFSFPSRLLQKMAFWTVIYKIGNLITAEVQSFVSKHMRNRKKVQTDVMSIDHATDLHISVEA